MEEVWPVRRTRGSLFPCENERRLDSFPSASPGFCVWTQTAFIRTNVHARPPVTRLHKENNDRVTRNGWSAHTMSCLRRDSDAWSVGWKRGWSVGPRTASSRMFVTQNPEHEREMDSPLTVVTVTSVAGKRETRLTKMSEFHRKTRGGEQVDSGFESGKGKKPVTISSLQQLAHVTRLLEQVRPTDRCVGTRERPHVCSASAE